MTREQKVRAKRVAERLLGTGKEVPLALLPPTDIGVMDASCLRIRAINEQISELELEKRIYMDEVKRIAAASGATRVVGGDWLLACTQRHSSRIVPEKLLEAGVELSVIEGATEEKTSDVWAVTAKAKGGARG